MKTSTFFEKCIPLIESHKHQYICTAIREIEQSRWFGWLRPAVHPAHQVIFERLQGHFSFNTFLYTIMGYEPSRDEMYKLRIAWLKSLVAEFKAKGD